MTPDAFRRFLLILACTAYVVGLGLVWLWLGWVLCVAAGLVGPLYALILTIELEPAKKATREESREPEGFSIRQIDRLTASR